jgi:hypothetical protein
LVVIADPANSGPCQPPDQGDRKDIDPGIFMPPRDTHVNFTIRRIVPKECVDPGIFGPRSKK